MLTGLRREIQEALANVPVTRKPALRRSDDPDALLATDLPLVADSVAVERFVRLLAEGNWKAWEKNGWLMLDAEVPVPPCEAPDELGREETGNCISLLLRHPGGGADQRTIRAVVKAAECGKDALERLCGQLHAGWAAALREHRILPGGLLPYLCRAVNMTKE